MKKQNIQKAAAVIIPTALFLALVSPAFAQDATIGVTTTGASASVTTKASANAATKQAAIATRTTTEITTRISTLNGLLTRLTGMKHVTADQKASLTASIQSTISTLTTLKTKIAGDTTTAEFKADAQSITAGNRIYLLIEPQLRIIAAADSAGSVADTITATGTKTQARITTAQSQGDDVTSLVSLQADMTAKVADANTQSAAAVALVSGLAPDNGDATVEASNTAALKSARADIATATADLKTAQKDIRQVIAGITKSEKTASASASTSTTAPATTTTQ